MKKVILVFVGSLLFSVCGVVTASVPVTALTLTKISPVSTYYTGELEAVEKGVLSFEEPGYLEYIAPVGEYAFSPIKNFKTGEILRAGTVLAKQKIDKREYELKIAIMEERIEEVDFLAARRDFQRNKKLIAKNVVSMKAFNDSKTHFLNAKLALDKAVNNVMIAQYLVDRATLIAPFSGVVTKVFLQAGARAGDGDSAVELTKMSPLLVKIPFPPEIVNKFKEGAEVNVYPVCGNKPQKAWCTTNISNDMLYAYVNNEIIPTMNLTPEQEKLKKVFRLYPVIHIAPDIHIVGELGEVVQSVHLTVPLAVPVDAVHTDKNGTYILKVNRKDRRDLFEFTVNKVYIKLGDVKKTFNLGLGREVEVQSIKKTDKLNVDDLLVFSCEDGIQDGETVIKENLHWKFMPGQLIKLSIPALCKPGFYVPGNAIIHQADGDNYVYIVVNGKAKLREVEITGRSSGYNCITSSEIKAGDQVIVLDRAKMALELYDGAVVKIHEIYQQPIRLTKPRASELLEPLKSIRSSYYK
jgi:multidrug efflux pump subunit AcrA (membrane-fusion protein)